MRIAKPWYLSLAVVLIVAGCSSDDGSGDAKSDSDSVDSVDFGEPADSTDADRVVEIEANDDFGFDPDTLEVEAGEVITFSVTNVGDLDHDFTLGPLEVQEAHEAEMAEMGEMEASDHGKDPNAISIPSGATEELTWRFTESGEVLMGCHTEGHWAKGMRGEIDVVEPA